MAQSATPLPPADDLEFSSASRIVAAGEELSFDVTFGENPSAPLADFALAFPDFVLAAPPAPLTGGGVRVRGRLTQPGFHAVSASARVAGRTATGRDYFVVGEPAPVTATHEAGYYVFLGCGDCPIVIEKETHALADWTLQQWKDLVSWMGAHGMNRLWTLVNGYTLVYPSNRWPQLRDRYARNVRENFLRELIDHAHTCGVKVYLMLTTDGHARDFVHAYPQAARLGADGKPGIHYGLALEHPLTRDFIFGTLDEVLELYPNADGVAVHPTESDPERFNPESLAAYRAETGRDLRTETPEARRVWHNVAFAKFMQEFAARCHRHNPALDLVMANCWWQDDHVALNHAHLPPSLRVAVWHYAWEDADNIPWSLHRWRESFPADRLIYVPTSQSYLYPKDQRQVMTRHLGTHRLVRTAAGLGVRNTLYFAGWDILPEPARLLDVALVHHVDGS